MEGHSVSGESRKNGWVEQKKQLTKVLKIAWPAVFESFFISLAGMIDVYMVSGLGSEAVASVGLTTQPKFLGLSLFFAMNVAIAAIVARRTGEKDKRRANETLAEAILLTILFGAVITVACVSLAGWLMEKCGSAPDTHDGAVIYFQIIMGGMIFNIISMVINAAQRGAGNTKIAMYTNTISSIVNIIGNYLLIGGHLGFPKLGIRGAALATVLGTVVGCTISVMSLFRKDSFLSIPYIIKEGLWKRFESVKIILKLSSSTFVEQILMRIGFMSTAVMAADMGTAAMAAHQVGMNFLNIGFAFGDGMQIAAVALVGRSLGEKNIDKAKEYAKITQKVGLVISLCLSAVFAFLGKPLFGLFFKQEHMMAMGVMICIFIAVIMPIQICKIINSGVLRGAGDVKFTLFQSVFSITLVQPLSTWLLMMYLKLGLTGVWGSILLTQFLQCVLLGGRYLSNKWTTKKI